MGLFSEDFVSFAGTPYEGLFANGAINSPGVILTNLFSNTFDLISEYVGIGLEKAGAQEWTIGLINDGVVGGIFAVLGFLPQILFLFLFSQFWKIPVIWLVLPLSLTVSLENLVSLVVLSCL